MSNAKARRVDFYPDEYVTGVGGVLRADEQGVYWMVCSLIMSEGGSIDENVRRLAALCCMRPADMRRILNGLVASGKLIREDDGKLSQKRAQSEVKKTLKRIQTASENGSKGGRANQKSQQNQRNKKANGFRGEKTNHQLATTNQQPLEKETPSGVSKKGCRLPENFEPDIGAAEAVGLSHSDALREVPKFRDYWISQPGQRGVKLDWQATWRNWCRKAAEERHPVSRATSPPAARTVAEAAKSRLREMRMMPDGIDSTDRRVDEGERGADASGTGHTRHFTLPANVLGRI